MGLTEGILSGHHDTVGGRQCEDDMRLQKRHAWQGTRHLNCCLLGAQAACPRSRLPHVRSPRPQHTLSLGAANSVDPQFCAFHLLCSSYRPISQASPAGLREQKGPCEHRRVPTRSPPDPEVKAPPTPTSLKETLALCHLPCDSAKLSRCY